MRVCLLPLSSVRLHQTQQVKRSPLEWDKVRAGKLPGHRLEQHESKRDFLTFRIWTGGER